MLTFIALALVATVLASSSSSSSSSSSGGIVRAGHKVAAEEIVYFGDSFYFWNQQATAIYQKSVENCRAVVVEGADSDDVQRIRNSGGFRLCDNDELIAINKYLTSKNSANTLDGHYWTGIKYEGGYGAQAVFDLAQFIAGRFEPLVDSDITDRGGIYVSTDNSDGADSPDRLQEPYHSFCCAAGVSDRTSLVYAA
jgi:hypothetical protein